MLLLHGDHVADKFEPSKNASLCGQVLNIDKLSSVRSHFFSSLKVLVHERGELEQDFIF